MKKKNALTLLAALAGLVLAGCDTTAPATSDPGENPDVSSEIAGSDVSSEVSNPADDPTGGSTTSDPTSTPETPNFDVFTVRIIAATGVEITSDKATAEAGETVTLTVNVLEGYTLTALTMNGTPLTVTDGKATFTMPDGDATIRATVTVNGDIIVGGVATAAFVEQDDGTYIARNVVVPTGGGYIYVKVAAENGTPNYFGYDSLDLYKCFGNITYYYSSSNSVNLGTIAVADGVELSDSKARESLISIGGDCSYDIVYDPNNVGHELSIQRVAVNALPETWQQVYALFEGGIKSESPCFPNGVSEVNFYDSAAGNNGENYHWVKYSDGSSYALVTDDRYDTPVAHVYKEIVDGQLVVVDSYVQSRNYTAMDGDEERLDSTASDDTRAYSGRYDIVDVVEDGYSAYQYTERDAEFIAGSYDHTMESIDMMQYRAYRHSFEIEDDLVRADLKISSVRNDDGGFTVTIDSEKEWNPESSGSTYQTMTSSTLGTWDVTMKFNAAGAIVSGTYMEKAYTSSDYDFSTDTFLGDPLTTGKVVRELAYSYGYDAPAANPKTFDTTPYFATSITASIQVSDREENVLEAGWDTLNDYATITITPTPSTALDTWQYGVIASSDHNKVAPMASSATNWEAVGSDGTCVLTFGNHTDNSVTYDLTVSFGVNYFHSLSWTPWEGWYDESIVTASNVVLYGNTSHTVKLSTSPSDGTLTGLTWSADVENVVTLTLDRTTGKCDISANNVTATTVVTFTFTSPYFDNASKTDTLQVTVYPGSDDEVSTNSLAGTWRVEESETSSNYNPNDPTVLTLNADGTGSVAMNDTDATFTVSFDWTLNESTYEIKTSNRVVTSGSLTYDWLYVYMIYEPSSGKVGVCLYTEEADWGSYSSVYTDYLGGANYDDEGYLDSYDYVFFVKAA